METKIQKTLKLWFPMAFAYKTLNGSDSDYEILQQFARYTLKLIQENNENEKEPFKIMNVLYQNGACMIKMPLKMNPSEFALWQKALVH